MCGPLIWRITRMDRRVSTIRCLDVVCHPVLLHHLIRRRVKGHTLLEPWQEILPSPLLPVRLLVLIACSPDPGIIILGASTVKYHAVDGRASSDDTSCRHLVP